jgi:CheY-like chemotaxis protein
MILQIDKDINDEIIKYENILKSVTKLDNITIFIKKGSNIYSPRLGKTIFIKNCINGILTEVYFTKKVHTIIDITNSFLYNKKIDAVDYIQKTNIMDIPILDKNNNILGIIELNFEDTTRLYLDMITQTIDDITKTIKSLDTPPKKHQPTVLLVDDSFIMLKFISSILKNNNLDVITASSGLEGIEKFKYNNIDVIFMDDTMVGLSGHETIVKIRDIERDKNQDPIPIFGVTSDTTRESKELILDSGANLVLHKPIKQENIIEAMKLFLLL